MKELAIGEIGLVDGKPVKCIEWDTLEGGCRGCAFYAKECETSTTCPCTENKRKDKKNVMFVPVDSCTWTQVSDGIWHTSCGLAHVFTAGTPEENHHRYCPYCGKVLEAVYYKEGDR
jgi:hypothetical protein